jgi:hypothetical protein
VVGYVIDENVLIFAHLGRNEKGENDLACLAFFRAVVRRCDPIVLSLEVWEKYHKQLSVRRSETAPPHLLQVLRSVATRADKLRFRDAPAFLEESALDPGSSDDVVFVRLAVAAGATLITKDAPLQSCVNDSDIAVKYGIVARTPEEELASGEWPD